MAALQVYADALDGIEESQEACYNLARAYLVLGLTHLAEPLLRRCLTMPSEIDRRVNALNASAAASTAAAVTDSNGTVIGEGHVFPQQSLRIRDAAVRRYLQARGIGAKRHVAAAAQDEDDDGEAEGVTVAAPPAKRTPAASSTAPAPLEDPVTNLRREAAHNLARLYAVSGSPGDARAVLFEHIVW